MFEDDATQILNVGKPQAYPKEIRDEFLMPPPKLPPNLKNKQVSFGQQGIKNEPAEIDQTLIIPKARPEFSIDDAT